MFKFWRRHPKQSMLTWRPTQHFNGGYLFAWPGQTVTCVRGCVVCEVAEPLYTCVPISIEAFKNWRIRLPPPGAWLPLQCECGGSVVLEHINTLGHFNGLRFRVNGRWVP